LQAEIRITPDLAIPLAEIELRFSRSSGPGGQKVNKTATRVELQFDVANSTALSDGQRERLLERLRGQLDSRGVLHLSSSEYASQWRNRQEVIERLRVVLAQGLRVPRRRIPTRPTRSSIERRLTLKRLRADVKRQRRRPGSSDW
jgi:ribosome-associated protein